MPDADALPGHTAGDGDAPPVADLDRLLDIALEAALAAGDALLEGQHRVRADIGTKSSPTDMVTDMDRSAEALIRTVLLAHRPDDAILGEEGGPTAGRSGVRWIIDPLDGTTNYLYGHPMYAVSVAAEVDGRVAVGVVHHPPRSETFTARLGGGAYMGDVRREGVGAPLLGAALVGTGFSYLPERRAWQGAILRHVLPVCRDVRRGGAASLDLSWVAARRLDAFYEWGLAPWDVAAGSLIAAEAGASVATLHGGPSSSDTTFAAPPHLEAAFRELLTKAIAASADEEPETTTEAPPSP
jgi:myo-inositol-1(or 4)-monophosphatase